ncbi:MAG: hypothetical protein H6732_01965 [Alphaproteobacteria bacterium]|nr:hypothetical protein [Alphaproteobacteria bacterium]
MLLGSLLLATAHAGTPDADDSLFNLDDKPVGVVLQAEVGFLATLDHTLQFGKDGTRVDVPDELGQSTLAPFLRFQADLDIGTRRRNTISLLYQPLDLTSQVAPERDLVVGDVTFPAGRGLDFRYGFSFFRGTWLYDLLPARDKEVALGLGLQIRNADIVYAARDGSAVVASRDVGPVPLLAFRGRGTLTRRLWMAGEVQGFYAPIKYLNGTGADVEGAIADASVKLGLAAPKGTDAFLAVRYVGGGASGTSSAPDPFTDGFVDNWVHFLSVSLGVLLH